MTLRTRRFFFYGLIFLFAIAGATITFYSKGWGINFVNCEIANFKNCEIKFEKNGAIFIQTKPHNVIIKIDGKIFEDKSGVIQSGTLIANLRPKTYKVEITKDGYLPWRKNMKVLPELVAEADHIVLIPKKIDAEAIEIPRLRGQTIESFDSGKFILKDRVSGVYYLYDLNNLETVFNISINFKNLTAVKQTIQKTAIHPFNSGKLIVETDKGLYILDTTRLELTGILETKPLSWTVKDSTIYYIKEVKKQSSAAKDFGLFSFNLILKTEKQILELPTALVNESRIARIDASSPERIAFLDNLGDLYIFNRTAAGLQKIGKNVLIFAFSPDGKKIAYIATRNYTDWTQNDAENGPRPPAIAFGSDRWRAGESVLSPRPTSPASELVGGRARESAFSLNILFLDDWNADNPKKAGDIVQFTLENQPSKIEWYKDSYHLFIARTNTDTTRTNTDSLYKSVLYLMEIDDRLPNNHYTLKENVGDNFHYDADSNFIYYLKGKLYRIPV